MATDGLAYPLSYVRPRFAPWVAEAAFVAFLLLVFIGLQPFEVRDTATLATASGAGSLARQLCYILVFGVIVAAAYDRDRLDSLKIVPIGIVIVLAWCALSAGWAAVPGIVIRRAGLEFLLVLSAMLSVNTLGPERALRLWYYVLAAILLIDWISIPLVPQAVHLAGENDPSIIGDWRGLYFQKNIAGAVTAISAMVFLYYFLRQRRWLDLGLLVAALGFLAMTRSKSSLGFLPMALIFAAAYRWGWRRDLDRMIVTIGAVLLFIVIAVIAMAHAEQISRFLQKPEGFTGRTEIWQAEIEFIRDHLWFGAGYGTFADTGGQSPLHNYVDMKWVATQPHGHNGYLQLLVTIGGIGFALSMLAFVVMPFVDFWRRDVDNLALKSLLFGIFGFVVLHNILESDYLESDGVTWISLLIVIAMMRTLRPQALARRRAPS